MKGILLIRGGAIGDFICTLPIAAELKRALPETPLALVAYDRVLPLARASGLFSESRSIESRGFAGFFADRGELDPEWMEFIGGFGVVLSMLYDPDRILEANLKRCEVRDVHSLDPRPDGSRHACEHLASILQRIGIFPERVAPAFRLEGKTSSFDVAVHLGSGSEKKNWSLDNWRDVLGFLAAHDLRVAALAGEADQERVDALSSALAAPGTTLFRNRPLLEVGQVLQGVRVFVGHDSGITHLAAALGAPALALFGPTDPAVWGPLGARARVLRGNKIWTRGEGPSAESAISVDENSPELVKAQLTQILGIE
ncbi:MAG: glycosyltransferase family 9 protein [Verrucomicrobiae bacterium]|nr:glycosyltransferase family 9 protein [Verrucomicrobiae bacterium]